VIKACHVIFYHVTKIRKHLSIYVNIVNNILYLMYSQNCKCELISLQKFFVVHPMGLCCQEFFNIKKNNKKIFYHRNVCLSIYSVCFRFANMDVNYVINVDNNLILYVNKLSKLRGRATFF